MKKNIIPMILPYLKRATLLIASAYLFLLVGCTDPNDEFILGTQNDQSKVTIVITVPGAKLPTTRGMADGKGEETVKGIDILVFDSTASPEKLEEHVAVAEADIEPCTDGGSDYKVVFKAALSSRTTASRLVIVANAHDQVTTMLGAISQAKTKKEVMENLLFATTGAGENRKWKADGDTEGGYTPIPMYAEKEMEKIQSGTQIDAIALQRMLARIDVINNATTKFTLEKIHLVNYNLAGYIAPAWDEDNGNLLTDAPDDPYIPGSANPQTGAANALAYTYTDSGTGYEGEIYTYESVAAKDGTTSDLGRKNATCLVLEGKMVGDDVTPHFYRVDFSKYQETISDPDIIPYIPLRRNHKYKVDIQAVEGVGYGSLVDALNSYTVVSNLKTRIIAYDQGKIKDVVYDGQYMLGVEDKEVQISGDIQEFNVEIVTDITTGYIATIPDVADSWLTIVSGGSSSSGGSSTLRLKADTSNVGEPANRTATVNIKAGRLSLDLIISQTTESKFKLRITDVDGNEISELNFLFAVLRTEKPTPMTFAVQWEGVEECVVTQKLPSNSPFLFDDLSDLPAGTTGDTNTGITYTGNCKMFTIIPSENYPVSQSVNPKWTVDLAFKITDPTFGSTVTKSLKFTFAREYMSMSHSFIGAFWRWNQWGERLIRMSIPVGNWTATVIEGDFIVLDTRLSSDPDIWKEGVIPADMSTHDAKYRLSASASSTISGTAMQRNNNYEANLYFRIGLTGEHPHGEEAGINGTAIPRFGKVEVTHTEGSEIIYIRQGEAPVEVISGSNVYWTTYNVSDPARGTGGENIEYHNDISTGDTEFNSLKFAEYPTQPGYYFQLNNNRAFHPTNRQTINGWLTNSESTWDDVNNICPAGYRLPILYCPGFPYPHSGEYVSGLAVRSNNYYGENGIFGYYADGYFDRMHLILGEDDNSTINSVGSGNKIAYAGRLFYDSTGSTMAHLFFPSLGARKGTSGELSFAGISGVYWASTGNYIYISNGGSPTRLNGSTNDAYAVRCIKDGMP